MSETESGRAALRAEINQLSGLAHWALPLCPLGGAAGGAGTVTWLTGFPWGLPLLLLGVSILIVAVVANSSPMCRHRYERRRIATIMAHREEQKGQQ